MPMGFGPFVGFPQEQPQMPQGDAMSMMQQLLGTMTGQMGDAAQMPGAPMMDMPQQTGQLGSMAAIFAASMADQLGKRQQHLAGAQRTLAGQEEERLAAQHYNIKTQAANMRQQQLTRLGFLEQINEIKLKMAQEQGNIDEIEKRHKNAMKLQNDRQKWQDQNSAAEAEAKANEPVEPPKPLTTVSQDVNAQRIVRASPLGKKFYDIKGDFGTYEDLGKKTALGMDWLHKDSPYQQGPMVEEARPEIIKDAKEFIASTPSFAQKTIALGMMLEAMKDENGLIGRDTPDEIEFLDMVAKFVPNGREWLATHGQSHLLAGN